MQEPPRLQTLPHANAIGTAVLANNAHRRFIARPAFRQHIGDPGAVDGGTVHVGGRSIVKPAMIDHPLATLPAFGKMSSATLTFVLNRTLKSGARVRNGLAIASGLGPEADGCRFRAGGR